MDHITHFLHYGLTPCLFVVETYFDTAMETLQAITQTRKEVIEMIVASTVVLIILLCIGNFMLARRMTKMSHELDRVADVCASEASPSVTGQITYAEMKMLHKSLFIPIFPQTFEGELIGAPLLIDDKPRTQVEPESGRSERSVSVTTTEEDDKEVKFVTLFHSPDSEEGSMSSRSPSPSPERATSPSIVTEQTHHPLHPEFEYVQSLSVPEPSVIPFSPSSNLNDSVEVYDGKSEVDVLSAPGSSSSSNES